MPLYRGSIQLGSFEDYFVYLTNGDGKNFGKPYSTYKVEKSEMFGQGMAEDIKTVLKVPEVDTKGSTQLLEAKKPAVPESETRHVAETASEQKVAQVPQVKKPLESAEIKKALKEDVPVKEKEAEVKKELRKAEERPAKEETEESSTSNTSKKASSKVEKAAKETAVSPKEEGAKLRASGDTGLEAKATPPEVDSGFFLKTMSGNMVMPFDAGFKGETIHKEKASGTEKKSGHEIETAEKKAAPAGKHT